MEVNSLAPTTLSLKGKAALITGGTNDIGEAICFSFAKAGARVFVMDTDKARGKDLESRLKKGDYEARFYKGDVVKSYDLKKAFKEIESSFGGLDILVNSAASALIKTLEENNGKLTTELRKRYALIAFKRTAGYDAAIVYYLEETL